MCVGAGLKGKRELREAGLLPLALPQYPWLLEEDSGSVSTKPPPSLCFKGLILLPETPSKFTADLLHAQVHGPPDPLSPALGARNETHPKEITELKVLGRCYPGGPRAGGLEGKEGFSRRDG